jgi:hypothetical protein
MPQLYCYMCWRTKLLAHQTKWRTKWRTKTTGAPKPLAHQNLRRTKTTGDANH